MCGVAVQCISTLLWLTTFSMSSFSTHFSLSHSLSLTHHLQQVSANSGVMSSYYPSAPSPSSAATSNRPRSYSAGSQQQSVGVLGKKSTTSGTSIKVIRVNSASKAYVKVKSPDDTKGGGLSRYKTELCRPFQDYGYCKYGDKCQFAHGEHELRIVPRHPKYKTELCRTYHTRGFCPYGSRCHFIHQLDEARKQEGANTNGGANTGAPRSPTKKTLSFSLPISPSLDSGISSPDDILGYGRRFEFPPSATLEQTSGSSGSGSDDDYDQSAFYDPAYSADDLSCPTFYDGSSDGLVLPSSEQGSSPDAFMEFDVLSTGSGSPTKPVSDGFGSATGPELSELLGQMTLMEQPPPQSPKSGRRLPVFDDMLNSKSDTALLEEGLDAAAKSFLFPVRH